MTAEQIPFWERLTCSVDEACMVTSLGRSNILKMIERGELETRKIGRRRLVVISSLKALVN
jgi:excisionase family DNA binding protein